MIIKGDGPRLRDYLVTSGWIKNRKDTLCRCPFHNDRRPSAAIHPNSLYCYRCCENFDLRRIGERFGVRLSLDPETEVVADDGPEKVMMFWY